MSTERLTIGELSHRTGVPVKTLRFWSDEGLLPPAGRKASGYRLYAEAETIVRLDLLRTLREAGLGLDAIKKVLRRDMSLGDALRLRLAAVEAHAASLSRVAAALRAALRGEGTESDLRRLCAVTRLTNEEREAVIEGFYARVSEGIPVDDAWQKKMIEASAPRLPDNPTPEQLDAWIELAELVADPTFIERLRASAKEVWDKRIDMTALRVANQETAAAAAAARARGASPTSADGKKVVETFLEGLGRASANPVDDTLRRGLRDRFAKHDPRASRYWELVSIMNGTAPPVGNVEDWKFVAAAASHHLADV